MPTNHIVSILARQSPFAIGTDELDREVFSVNFDLIVNHPWYSIEKTILNLLLSPSPSPLITLNSDIFVGHQPELPSGDGPYTTLILTGGTGPEEAHSGERWDYLSFQLLVRAKDYMMACDKIVAEWNRLHGTRNQDVSYI